MVALMRLSSIFKIITYNYYRIFQYVLSLITSSAVPFSRPLSGSAQYQTVVLIWRVSLFILVIVWFEVVLVAPISWGPRLFSTLIDWLLLY